MVAVDTRDRVAIASGVRDIEFWAPVTQMVGGRILRGAGIASRAWLSVPLVERISLPYRTLCD
jgi:hypothetical protein